MAKMFASDSLSHKYVKWHKALSTWHMAHGTWHSVIMTFIKMKFGIMMHRIMKLSMPFSIMTFGITAFSMCFRIHNASFFLKFRMGTIS
jgi:hypothetical protein